MTFRICAVAWTGLAVAIATASPQVPDAATARLSGTVVATDTGEPIPSVRIAVRPSPSSAPARTVVSDAAGRYEVTALPAGTYLVSASRPGLVGATFGRRHEIDLGGAITLLRGQRRTGVNFQLSREAILAGRVIGADGRGLAGVVIKVSRPHVAGGQRQLVSFGSARSDDNGDYLVTGLPPGDYYVSASFFLQGDSRAATYAPTFYPASGNVATATRLRLAAGVTKRIEAITPKVVPWAGLTGRLESFDKKALVRGALVLQPRDPEGLSLSPDAAPEVFPDGRFSIAFVLPGQYVVRAQGNTGTSDPDLFAAWPVDVAGLPVGEHMMTLRPGSTVTGAVVFEAHGTRRPADLTSIRVSAPLVDGSHFASESEAYVRRDGTFTLASVDAGSRLIRVDGLPPPWSLARVTRRGVDVTDSPLEIVQQQKLDDVVIVLSDIVTGLTGQVRSQAGAPLVDYMVVAFPVDQARWRPRSRFILATRTDWDGRHRLASLPPGDYRVAAAHDFEESEIYERDVLDQLRLRSIGVTLTSGALRVQPLEITLGQRSR